MRFLKALSFLLFSALAFGQATRPQSCNLATTQTCKIGNANGAYGASFEEIPSGSPSGVSVTIQGCMQANTCDSASDTNTSTSATVRGVTFSKVYDYFLITATLTGGTSPKIAINSIVTTANSHQGGNGGGGCIATASTLSASCGTIKGTIASITDGNTASDCTVGGGTNVVVCEYTGSTWVFAGNSGSAPTYAQVLTGTNVGQVHTTGSGGTLNTSGTAIVDFSTLGTFKVPAGAGFAATAAVMLGYDSTATALHGWNGADSVWPLGEAAVSHNFLTSFTRSTGAFGQAQPAFTDISGAATTAQLPGTGATTVNGQTCTLGSTCTVPEQVNTVNLTSQAGFNLLTSTANTIGLTVTPTNSATNQLKFEATGTVTIGGGGTGQATAAAGFDALAPTTTRGDIIARGASGNIRLALGSNGACLTSNGTDAVWNSCATGSIGGTGTANAMAKFTASATIGNSLLTDDATTAAYSGTGGLNLSAGPLKLTEIVAPAGSAGSSWLWSDSTALRLQMKNGSNTAVNVVASGVDINSSDQVTATHLAAALPVNQGGTGTTSTLTGLVRGSAGAMTAAELSADVTTSGSNVATVVALRGAALPTLAASTGLLYDTAGTLSLPGALPAAAEPAHTGDATNSAGSLAMTVVALRNAALPTLAASTGLLFDTAGTLSLPATLPTSAVPAFTGDMTNSSGSLATTVAKINGTAFSGVNGHLVGFGAANIPTDSGLVSANVINYTSPATGIARTTSGSQNLVGTELSGDATTSGSNAVTVVKINGNSVPSGAAVHQTLVATGASTLAWKTITDCNGSSNALNYTQSTDLFSCLSIATLSNPMTTLGDMIVGGSAGVVSRLVGPTSGNSPYVLISAPSGGVATTPAWSVTGVPVDSESGATFTVQSDAQTAPDRAKLLLTTNATTSTAVTVPQAGSASMLTNYPFVHCNTGSVVATDTPTTSTINSNAAMKLVGAVSTHNPECAFWWSDALSTTGNWWGAEILPTDANGLLAAEGVPAFTGDVTKAAGSLATTVTAINGTAFSGTSGHLVGFGAANVPTDSGLVSANVVTAAANYTSGDLVQASASTRATSDSGIATANVVTAASNYSSGGLIYAAAANKTTTNSADWAISSHTMSGGSAGILTSAANGAASAPAVNVTGTVFTGGSGTTTFPLTYFNQGAAVTTFSTAGTELGFNAPSGFTGNFLDFHVNGGASLAKLDSGGNLTVASCTGCGGGVPAFPVTVTGGVSGAIPYFSSTTVESVSALLAANALMVGGGSGAAPSTVTTGTGVVTALGVNTGSAGAFVVNGGVLGTPSSGTLTNATGLPVGGIATIAADTMAANMTAGPASPTAVAMPTTAHGVWLAEGTASPPVATAAGTASQLFSSGGSGADPGYKSWADLDSTQYVAGGGTAQAQTATLAPAATSLVNGLEINFLPVAANTGAAPTLAVNGLAAKPITKLGTAALVANDLTTTAIASVIYDGTEFQLQNPQTSTGGGVTSIATTSPITGGTITTTGTIACATCVTSAASLTSGAIMTGAGSQGSQTNTTGTGVVTALGVNIGTAGAFVVNGGALGTPSSGTLTSATGYLWNNNAAPTGNLGPLAMAGNTSIYTTTTAEAQMFAWKNTTAAVVGTSQGSPVPAICGTAFHASASVEDCLTLGELPGNGNDAAITFTLGHTGTSTGPVTFAVPGGETLGTAPTVTTPGTGFYEFGTPGTEPASIAATTNGFVSDSTSNCLIFWYNAANVGCGAVLNGANTAGTAMTLDMSAATGATAFKVPVIAGATAGANGVIDYDSTNGNMHVRTNGADSINTAEAAAITLNLITKATDSTHGLITASSITDDGKNITTAEVFLGGNTVRLASDFTDSTSSTLQLITGLSYTLPTSKAATVSFHCMLLFDQGTAAVSDQFGIGVTGTAPTQANASATVFTSASVSQTGTLTALASTTPTAVVTFTPSAITTIWKAELDGTIEQPSNATPGVFSIYAQTTTGSDNLIVKRGSFCTLF